MTSLVQQQAALYTELWSSVEPYAEVSPGETHVAMFQAMTGAVSGSVLDAGTGSGKGAVALSKAGFTVTMCDLTSAGLSDEAKTIGPCFEISLWHDLHPVAYLGGLASAKWDDGRPLWDAKGPQGPIDRPFRRSLAFQSDDREAFDYVYCCDVLEHIPTEYTMLTISRLLEVATNGVFLTIALVPDQFGVWVGQPLHHTVQPFQWWRDRLKDLGELIECRDCLLHGVYLVKQR